MPDKKSENEEFVVFRIREQEFCVEMASTNELRGWVPATPLPNSADYLVGIINLRGKVLPILDLASRLGFTPTEQSNRHVVIVVQFEDKQFGLLVDAVSDIIFATPENIRSVPNLNTEVAEKFFKQVIVQDNRIICQILLDQLLPELDAVLEKIAA